MTTIEQSMDVEVPVSTAYNQWTQFEEFPRFMDGVKSVEAVEAVEPMDAMKRKRPGWWLHHPGPNLLHR